MEADATVPLQKCACCWEEGFTFFSFFFPQSIPSRWYTAGNLSHRKIDMLNPIMEESIRGFNCFPPAPSSCLWKRIGKRTGG